MFTLIGSEVAHFRGRAALVMCTIVVSGAQKRAGFYLPISAIRTSKQGVQVPGWIIDSRRQQYRSETGRCCQFIAEEIQG